MGSNGCFWYTPDEINRVLLRFFEHPVGELVVDENTIPVVLTFAGNIKNSINKLKRLPLRSKTDKLSN